MSDDLVARLREEIKHWSGAMDTQVLVPLVNEAADEIERLRAALEGITAFGSCDECPYTTLLGCGVGKEAGQIARAALEGEK